MPAPLRSLVLSLVFAGSALADGTAGYYRQPTLHGRTVVFVAEDDLWKVDVAGGVARRLTTHPAAEAAPMLSPDGLTIGFIGRYEGTPEVYTMPVAGGRPVRRTYGANRARFVGWTPGGELMYATRQFSTLPNWQLVRLDISRDDIAGEPTIVPLAQAADGAYADDGTMLFFTRLPFQGSHTKRYQGGTAQNIWRFADGDAEATPLTGDWDGTSKRPMWWRERVYFATDRDETMNLWSMKPDGSDVRQHTRHTGWDVKTPSLQGGRIVYQLGADLRRYDIATDDDALIEITLESDLDQTREHWIDKPMDYVTSAFPSPDGDRVVLTARGRVFVAPHRQGRLVEASRTQGTRFRNARFLPGGERLAVLSDESGEVEVWTLPADGIGDAEQLTGDGVVLRWEAVPSPDGKWIAHRDKNFRLFIHDVEAGTDRQVDESSVNDIQQLAWSPDSRWLAAMVQDENQFHFLRVYPAADGEHVDVTTDRYESFSPAWSPDGKWLYFLSNRHLVTVVPSPWGQYQPEPFLDKKTQIFALALQSGLRSPFAPMNELVEKEEEGKGKGTEEEEEEGEEEEEEEEEEEGDAGGDGDDEEPALPDIEFEGITSRLHVVPVPPGNYSSLDVNETTLFWRDRGGAGDKTKLQAATITNLDFEVKTVAEDVADHVLTADGKKLMIRAGDALHLVDAKAAPATLDGKSKVDLSGWRLSVDPREEWRQMFMESWRLERDYFYDVGMHGVDWPAMRDKYLPLVERVTTRHELADLMGQMVSELAALHIFVVPGDVPASPDDVPPSSLGAVLERDEAAGGYRVAHVYRSDPDDLTRRSPLSRPGVDVGAGDVIEMLDGVATLASPSIGAPLRNRAGRQVRLRVRPADGADARDVIVEPLSLREASDLRYHEWEYTRRLEVEERGAGEIGYVHLRAMSGRNFTEWAKDFYPVYDRKGLIIDVRHNSGGNIDSWIIGRLLRKAWFNWTQRVGKAPFWNMQYAFRGHLVVLCNERTASDGEAFSEGVKRLDLGTVIGTRTWGGEIWLSSSNVLVDKGIATAAEFGVYGPEGEWLIEGWGVEPDVEVDNLPHATFNGRDAQLEAAIAHLQQRIRDEPIPDPPPPAYPDKSSRDNK